ncbi:response regulator transcription factor [Candidatus Hydrogenedentota bacterium]
MASRDKKRILLAEDEKDHGELLKMVLEAAGHEITLVGDGKTALRKLKHHAYDAVILDIMLPRVDGVEVCNKIRHSSRLRDMRVVVISALSQGSPSSEMEWCKRCQADVFVAKPYSVEDFVHRVKTLFEMPRKRWENVRETHLRDFLDIISRHTLASTSKVAGSKARKPAAFHPYGGGVGGTNNPRGPAAKI